MPLLFLGVILSKIKNKINGLEAHPRFSSIPFIEMVIAAKCSAYGKIMSY
jgi:hypothetical protein